jgi:subtilase family serine protease
LIEPDLLAAQGDFKMYAKLFSAVLAVVLFPLAVAAGPNLRVTSVTGPSPVDEGGTVSLSWTVSNVGDASASGPRSDRLVISRDATLGDDLFIAAFAINDSIAPGTSQTYTREVVLPQGVFGTAFLAAETDIGNSIAEDSETDNAFISTIATTVTGRIPDVVVTGMSAPQNPTAGSVILINWTSRNIGGVRLPRSDWYDRFFLSTDPQYDATGPNADLNIGEHYAVRGQLEPGASASTSFSVRLPRNVTGTFYLIVVSDWYNWFNEGVTGETNNAFTLVTPLVISSDRPNLAVTNVSLVTPGTLLTGQNDVQISYTVTNQGTAPATDEWYDRLVISRTADGATARTLVETRRQNQDLAPGASYTQTVEIDDFPGDGDRVGDVFLVLFADVYDQQPELPATRGDNTGSRAIALTPGDLVVTSFTPPATLNAGAEVTLNWQLTNQGLGRLNRSDWYDRVYLSVDNVFNTGGTNPDVNLGETYGVFGRLTTGQTSSNSLTARLPAGAIGQFYIIIVADWYDWVEEGVTGGVGETNNVFVLATPVTIADARPNLVVDSVSVTPSTINTGDDGVVINYTIRNTGTAAATGEWYDRTVLSRSANGENSPRTLNETRRQTNNIPPGGTYTGSFTVNDFPGDGDRVGDVFVVVRSDIYAQLPESSETDNSREQGVVVRPGDLVVTSVSTSGALNAGGLVTINWSGVNQGQGRINRTDWYDRVFLSRDAVFNTTGPDADINLGESYDVNTRLTNGQTWTNSLVARLPENASGQYFLIVVADWYDWIEEGVTGTTGETNNAFAGSQITIDTDRPNFQVAALSISDNTLVTGQNDVDITYTITNAGQAAAQGDWYDRVIISTSADGSNPRTLVETRRLNIDTPAGGSYTQTVQVDDFPGDGDRVGNVFIIVISDVYAQIPESDEADNRRSITATLSPADLQIQTLSINSNLRPGGPATLTWTTRNIGEGRTNRSDWYTRFFVSRDAVAGNGDDVLIGEDYNVPGRLFAGEQATSTWDFTIPANLSGEYYIVAVEDWYDWVEEGTPTSVGETNNRFISATAIANVVVPGDLEVTNISVPSNVSVGQSIEVFWTVRNNGPGTAEGTWVDEFLLSTDQALGSDISLGAASNPSTLAAGATYTASRTITVPPSATGTFFFIVRTDAAGAIFEVNENNNFRVNTQTFTAQRADLAVSNLTGPAEGSIGSNLTLNYNGINNGPGEAIGAWADRFVLSTNTVFGDSDDIFLGQLTVTGPQAAGNSTPRSVSLEVPGNTPSGTYTILMRSDFSNTISETDEANNTLVGTQVVIGGPDLQVADAIVQNAATLGRPLSVVYTQRNAGNRSTQRAWTDRLFISTDNVFGNANDVVLGEVSSGDVLVGGGERTRTFSGNMPASIGIGSYFLFVQGDVNGNLSETVEGNNVSLGTAFAVSAANLTVSGVTGPSSIGLGQNVTVSYAVNNPGDRAAAGRNDRIILSSDATVGNGDDRVLRTDFVAEVAAGNAATIERVVTVPADLTPGNYFFGVVVDASESVAETSETDNTALSSVTTIGGADLVVTNFAFPSSADLGVSFNATVSITNQGTLQAPARTDRVIASLNATIGDADDTVVGSRSAVALGAGQVDNTPISVTLPAGISATSVNLFVVADAAGSVAEINEGNNVAGPSLVTIRAIDLTATSITTDSTITAGATVTAVVTIANGGVLNAPASSVGVYLNTSGAFGGTRVGTAAVPAITAGSSAVVNVPVSIPQDPAASGQRFLIARADDGLVIAEASEVNNTASTSFTIRPTPQPNLTITQFAPPAAINDGEVFNVTWTTSNGGEANITGAFAEKLYLSTDAAFDAADTLLGTFVRSGGLGGGASFTRTDQAVVPAGLSGSFFLILVTDADGQITESNEGDNRVSRAATVNQSQLPDLQVAVLSLSSNRYAGQQLNAVYTVSNAGPGTVNGRIIDRVYFGPDTGGDVLSLEGLTQVAEFSRVEQIRPPFGYGNTANITLPGAPGAYRVVVVTDFDDRINETSNTNNRRAERLTVIVPEYTATVATNFSIGPSGSQIVLNGSATRTADGQPAGNADVVVQVRVRNTTRSLNVRTQPDGTYSTTFFPVPTEAGLYSVWARHPFAPEGPVQDGFELVGYGLTDGNESLRITPGQTLQGTFTVLNYGDQPIADLTAVVTNPVQGLDVVFEPIGRLEPLDSKLIRFTVTATNSNSFSAELAVQVASAAGIAAPRTGFIAVQAGPLAPRLESTPNPLIETMTRGTTRTVELVVRNVGGQATGAVQVSVPAAPWLFLSSPSTLPALQPNGEARIVLTLAPSETLTLGRYNGSVAINAGNASLSVPFQVDAVSSGLGTLTVFATDEFTYFADGGPRVQGATVVVRNAVTNVEVARGTTDDTGQVVFANLLEANYNVEATSPDHGRFGAGVLVQAGRNRTLEAFMPRQLVNYTWTVVPTTIQDSYNISIQATFETNVPAPVVTIEPALIDLDALPSVSQVNFTIRNRGLIIAEDVRLDVGGDGVTIQPLVSDLGDLPANSTVVVPAIITKTRAGAGCLRANLDTIYAAVCGERREYRVPVFFRAAGCGGTGVSGSGSWGGGFPGGGNGFPGGSGGGVSSCNPCNAVSPGLAVPGWVEQFFCCLTRNACLRSLIGCTPIPPVLTPLPDFLLPDPGAGAVTVRGAIGSIGGKAIDAGLGGAFPPYAVATCVCGLARDCVVGCFVSGAGSVPCSAGDIFSSVVGSAAGGRGGDGGEPDDLALAFLKQQRDRMVAVARVYAIIAGAQEWTQVNNPALFNPLWQGFINAGLAGSPGSFRVTDEERAALQALALPQPITPAILDRMINRWNRSQDYWDAGILNRNQVPAGQSGDFIAIDEFRAAVLDSNQSIGQLIDGGYTELTQAYVESRDALEAARFSTGQGTCVQVRIQIDQTLTLTRSAFAATLRIENESTTDPLENVQADVIIKDAEGNVRTNLFAVQGPRATGFGGGALGRTIGTESEGSLEWTLVPSRDAAPLVPTRYFVSGQFSYSVNGTSVNVPLAPTEITVVPNPSLNLKYFLQREVFSDDPFTESVVEPAKPFDLGLIVQNNGAGAANNVRLTSAQPRIIENVRGLPIEFRIIGTELNANPRTPSLSLDFENIGPGQAAVARFLMTATFQGTFTQYEATFTNNNGLGAPGLSIIDSVDIFSLIKTVKADRHSDDNLPDFMTNETPDPLNFPDRVHFSNGGVLPVTPIRTFSVSVDAAAQRAVVSASSAAPAGFTYLRINDPFGSQLNLSRVVRSDGRVIVPGFNAWQTSKINRDGSGGVEAGTPERYVHIFDFNSTGTYTLEFTSNEPLPPLSPFRLVANHAAAGELALPVRADGATSDSRGSINRILVQFAQPVSAASFTPSAIQLFGRDGITNQLVDLSGVALSTSLQAGGLLGVIDLSLPLPDRTRYCITLSGVQREAGGTAVENGRAAFVLLRGDVFGDSRVNNSDVGAALSLLGQTVQPDSSANLIRADVNRDGQITQADVDVVLAARRFDMRLTSDACPANVTGGDEPSGSDGLAGNPGVRSSDAYRTGELSASERELLSTSLAATAYAYDGQIVPLTVDGSSIIIKAPSSMAVSDLLRNVRAQVAGRAVVSGVEMLPLVDAQGMGLAMVRLAGPEASDAVSSIDEVASERRAQGEAQPNATAMAAMTALRQAGYTVSPVFVNQANMPMSPSDRVLAVVDATLTDENLAAMLEASGLRLISRDHLGMRGLVVAELATATSNLHDVLIAANRLLADPRIETAEPEWFIADTSGGLLKARGGANFEAQLRSISADAASVTLAVLADGVASSHQVMQGSSVMDDASLTGVLTARGQIGTMLASNVLAAADEITRLDDRATSVHLRHVRMMAIDARGTVWTSSLRWIAAIAQARSSAAKVTLTGMMTATGSDSVSLAYARTRSEGLMHIAASGDDAWLMATMFPGRAPAVVAVGAGDAQGLRASFTTTGARLAFLHRGVNLAASDLPGKAGLVNGDSVLASSSLLAAARTAGLAVHAAGDERLGASPAMIERVMRISGVGSSPGMSWSAANGWGVLSIDQFLATLATPGDLDGDGLAGSADLALLLQAASGGEGDERLDLTADGVIDMADVQAWMDLTR